MKKVVMYTKENCPFCTFAKDLLENKGLTYQEIHVDEDPKQLEEMIEKSGKRTVPQIFIDDQLIGGFDALQAYFKSQPKEDTK